MASATVISQLLNSALAPLIGETQGTTGNVFYLDSGQTLSADTSVKGKSVTNVFSTLDFAVSQCTANNGDIIYVMPGHAETTTAIGLDVAGVTVIGIGHGRARPVFTATTAATDLMDVTVANFHLENVVLVGAASGCTALIDTSTAGTDFSCLNCEFVHSADPLDTVTLNADRFHFKNCRWTGISGDNNNAIVIETTAVIDWIVEDCLFNYGTLGLDEACIAISKKTSGGIINNCIFSGMVLTAVDINSSTTARGDGIISNCSISAFAQTDNIDTLIDAGGFILIQNFASDLPAEAGGLVPVTTPA